MGRGGRGVPEALSVGVPGIATYPRGEMNGWRQEVWRRYTQATTKEDVTLD